MMTPCIKLHNFKKFKIEHEGQLYELAATSSENLLSEFQKYKPEVKQLLVARPIVAEDFDGLAEGSVVFASTQSYITEGQMEAAELQPNNSQLLALDYKLPPTSYPSQIANYSPVPSMSHSGDSQQKLRTDLSMIDNYCPHPSGFVEAVVDPGPIETDDVARRVRDILEKYKISQTLFSKYVIRRSQGTTSDLLRTPKQWDRMSEEGRTPYRRMKAWLDGDLTHNIQMLVRIKQGYEVVSPTLFPPKGLRTRFTDGQREALEQFYSHNPRLTHDTLQEFASEHNLTISAVRNWVNNRKQRMKRNHGSCFDEDDNMITRKLDKQISEEEELSQKSDSMTQNNLAITDGSKEMSCPGGVPTMVNTSVPTMVNTSMFNRETNNINETIKTEQRDRSATNVFENTVSKTEPDLDKYFPHGNVWEKK